MHISPTDRNLVREMREFGVLRDAEGHRLDQASGVILVACADGDQMPDLFRFQAGMSDGQREVPRVHVLALNGGALLIPDGSPITNVGEDRVIIEHLRGAQGLKGISTVALYVHAPCGMAYGAQLSFEGVIGLLMQAKTRVKEMVPGLRVACFCHVDKGEGNRRTYFVSRDEYDRWCLTRQERAEVSASAVSIHA